MSSTILPRPASHAAITALAVVLGATAALGQPAVRPLPESVMIGAATEEPEKDSLAFPAEAVAGVAGCVPNAPRYGTELVQVGAATGDPEKDSVGYVLREGPGACGPPAPLTAR